MSNLDDAIAEATPERYKDPFPRPYPDVKFVETDGKIVECIINGRKIKTPKTIP